MSNQSEAGNPLKENLETVYLALKIVAALLLIAALYQYSNSRPKYTLLNADEVSAPLKLNRSTGNVKALSEGGNTPSDVEWVNLGKGQAK